MKLTHDDVERIMKLLEASAFDALDLEIDGLKLSLRRRGAGAPEGVAGDPPTAAPAPSIATPAAGLRVAAPVPAGGVAAPATPSPAATPPPPAAPGADAADVVAPVLGTFYRAPKPGAPPFVEVGAAVSPDTVVCIVEVMKLMTSVTAGVAGEVVELLATDGALVEYGQPLLRIRRAA